MSETKIKITNLKKAFGRKVVLDGVDLEVKKGESPWSLSAAPEQENPF